MKVSGIKLNALQQEESIVDLYQAINATQTDYPREKSIVDIFQEMACQYADKIAVEHGNKNMCYRELNERSNQLAQWLLQRGVQHESVVAIYLNRSVDMIVSILGILKAGAAYLPLNNEYPIERTRNMISQAKASVLISESAFVREANLMQWLCPALRDILCIDTKDFYGEKESANPLMKKELWEYVGETAEDDIAGGGWQNSYTREKFSRQIMDEYSLNAYRKLQPYLSKSKKVLEIGCASGITMYRVAPSVKTYYGTDLSEAIIDFNRKRCAEEGIENIRLQCLSAGEIDQIDERDFDIIVINSVIQAFNGLNYLRMIIRKCSALLADKGVLFIGDVMDLDLKDKLIQSIQDFKKASPEANTKLDFSNELFVSRCFFDDLRHEMPEVKNVIHSSKIHTIQNELTEFRYDTILEIDRTANNANIPGAKHKHQFDSSVLEDLSARNTDVVVRPDQLSNIMFTSGSTGVPKGVLIEHRAIIRLVVNATFLDVRPEDKWLQTAEVSFDPSCMEIFGALLNGATLCMISKDVLLDSALLHRYMSDHRITILQLVSALFHELAAQRPELFSNVRKLVVGGEVLLPSRVKSVLQACPKLIMINAYGPTENCVVSTAFVIDGAYEKIPIGKPVSNSSVYVMDSDLQLQPIGVAGELCVCGDGLMRGYLGDPGLNTVQFINDPLVPSRMIYRTGDLVRIKPDLNLEFIGRKDSQVKIHGHRVELSEIEIAIKKILQTELVLVLLKGKKKSLCVYLVLAHELSVDGIKKLLSVNLPEHMIPAYVIRLKKFPLTTNGKIDTNALPEPEHCEDGENDIITLPANETESVLVNIYKEVLGRENISTDQNFFLLGGHSLLATQVISRINKVLNVSVKLRVIFNYPTVKGLAGEILRSTTLLFSEITPIATQNDYELSHAQLRLWVLSHMPEYRSAYNIADAYRFHGKLDIKALERSFQILSERHESLRTIFAVVDGHPRQKIINTSDFNFSLEQIDLTADDNQALTASAVLKEQASIHFDLEKGPLFRAKLLHLGDEKYVFMIVIHHIICDGWSLWILIKEILHLYNALVGKRDPALRPLTIQYKDYAAWQNKALNSTLSEKVRNYWLKRFQGEIPQLKLPIDFPRGDVRTSKAEKIFFSLSGEQSERLTKIVKTQAATLFMGVLSIIKVLLYKHTRQNEIVVGTPIAGRNHREVEDQIGLYLNILALKTCIVPDNTFVEYLNHVKETTLDAYDNQIYPFDRLIDDLKIERDVMRSPLFDVGFTWQNVDGPEGATHTYAFEGLQIEPFIYDHHEVKTDMWFHAWVSGGAIHISLAYNVGLFKRETIENIISEFMFIAARFACNPLDKINSVVNCLLSEQKEKTMENYNKIKDAKFEKFRAITKKSIQIGERPLVTQSVPEDAPYPVTITPNVEGLSLSQWLKSNRTLIQDLLRKTGGILFRNFNIDSMQTFQEVATALSERQMAYKDQSSPRTLLGEKTYTSTDHPADQVINMHNELSYSHDWPMQILFFCLQPSLTKGETPVADSRQVLALLTEETREKFMAKGIMYVRNLVNGLGLSWRDVYQTSDKGVVEQYCREKGIQYEWIGQDDLRIKWTRPAIQTHPVTGESTWFNHGFFFNAINLDESVHEAVGNKEMLPFNTFYGDGTDIEPGVLEELRNAFEKTKVYFTWKKGDILLLDNMLMAHGRNSYTGDRKILVAMNNPYSQTEVLV